MKEPRPAQKKTHKIGPPVGEAIDLPASEAGWHVASLVASLVDAGILGRAQPEEMAFHALNFEAACREAISRYIFDQPTEGLPSGGRRMNTVSASALARLAASLTKAKLITAHECEGDTRKLAQRALEFCHACGLFVQQRNIYCAEERQRANAWATLLSAYRANGRVPLEQVLDWAGLSNSTLVNEFKAEKVEKDWFLMTPQQKCEEMFRFLTREPIVFEWAELKAERGIAEQRREPATVGDASQIESMIQSGVPCADVPRVIEILKAAKRRKESAQKQRAALAAHQKKNSKANKDAE